MSVSASTFCPICKCIFADEDSKHRHIEESHDNLTIADIDLAEMEMEGKILLNEMSRASVRELCIGIRDKQILNKTKEIV
jgi:uncharacterized C2H2 Zn-finger protein